ncbi:hypothetical protein CWI38_0016p0030 [Hamiltosporidium tvaerminnensis]|uniref:Uncharacterized protein n=1 Tax=Hamiltosporidium tvaerminnensis TaxID=1176355 RepID=A0A4Q9M517_9MICR|nr:hypothetical protein CWI38_0016p0030 [Hamiltosporidium tvaerminnensis]
MLGKRTNSKERKSKLGNRKLRYGKKNQRKKLITHLKRVSKEENENCLRKYFFIKKKIGECNSCRTKHLIKKEKNSSGKENWDRENKGLWKKILLSNEKRQKFK